MDTPAQPAGGDPRRGLAAIPRSVWALGLVSMFMDISSEMIHGLLPVFLVTVLGASALSVGVIEGIAEATASIVKIFSGALSDRLGKRKLLAVIGYGLAAVTKPLFPLATGVSAVFAARFIDRVGKGIRGAPRDALIGDITPAAMRGAAYGLRQTLDTVGAFAGPLIAVALMAATAGDFRFVFWMAVIPAFLAVATLIVGVREPPRPAEETPSGAARTPIRLADVMQFGRSYWTLVAIATVAGTARFSEAFLILRAEDQGLSIALTPLVIAVMSAVFALSAYPAGRLSDRIDRRLVLVGGFVLLIAADLVLVVGRGIAGVFAGVVLWGLHLGATQGLFAAMIADAAPARLRGTAFGIFHFAGGLAMLVASVLAGFLWDRYGAEAAFLAAAGLAGAALAGLAFDLVQTRR
ncbi:MAG: MFS transporter [Rhodospirillales bacterium]|nr:MFS transporter [Rhodospirillales bacterium]